ncbi:hypothetical protein [uncultured Flavobacterium sp.]|uniref:hypothetical protein n=1 Tax=uncultured Flavobacterium sp. TaxID=165435 RepID=UPI0025D4CEB9|nr:hypothetical protein [uncultured Flavobacterium sp.]
MHSVSDILAVLLQSVFVGFGIVIPIVALIKTSNLKSIAVKDLFILTSVQMVRIAGILYIIISYLLVLQRMKAIEITGDRDAFMFGQLLSPILYFLLSQLFWIRKLYMKKAALIIFALLILTLPSQRVLAIFMSQGTDYFRRLGGGMFTGNAIIETALNVVVFIFIVFTIMLAGGKLKDIVGKQS